MLPKNEKLKKLIKHKTITSNLKRKLETKRRVYQEKMGLIDQILSKKVIDEPKKSGPAGKEVV